MKILNSGLAILGMMAATACSTSGGASKPVQDFESGAADPVYQPMLVVPLPELMRTSTPSGSPMQALQARQTPLGDVLLAMFKDSDINLVVEPDVQAVECTFDIKQSTVEQAFEALLESLDLAYVWDGNFLRIRSTIEETIAIDLIEPSANQGAGGQAGGGGSQGGGQGGNNQQSFWQDIEGALPKLLGNDASFVVNRTASSIHVEASPNSVRRLRAMVDQTMGRANRQVSLEARVLEVRLESEFSLGVDWALLPGVFNTSNSGLASGGGIISQNAAATGTALTFGLLDSGNFSVLVDALQKQGQVRVLSSPRVSTLNNQPASITVTDQVPYIVREVVTQEGIARTEYSVEFVEAGVLLNVRPLIGEDGLLSVSVTPSVRQQIGTVVTPDGLVSVPIISERQATTTVRVADGQAIALGGLRSTTKSESRQGLPFLMDLPWIGQLFSNTIQEQDEVELMIVLVPRVLTDTWINEEMQRGAHRLVQLRKKFAFNPLNLDHYRAEDWNTGSLQGVAQAANEPSARLPDPVSVGLPVDGGTTVTRRGLADHLIHRAASLIRSNELSMALTVLDKAVAIEPTRADAMIVAGVLYHRRGNNHRSRQLLDQALALKPDDVVALTARGTMEMSGGSVYAAQRYFSRAHALSKTKLTAANLGAALLALGDAAQALELMTGFAGGDAPPELYSNLAYAQLMADMPEEARQNINLALASGADSRNPRIVALDRLIADAELEWSKKVKLAVEPDSQ
jgi:MSHA biogenesis protein MshL